MAAPQLFRLQAPLSMNRSSSQSDAELGAYIVRYVILPQMPDFSWEDLQQLVQSGRLSGWWTDLKRGTWSVAKKGSNFFTYGTGETIINKLETFVKGVTDKSRSVTEAGETAQGLLASLGALFRTEQKTGAVSFIARKRTLLLTAGGVGIVYLVWRGIKK